MATRVAGKDAGNGEGGKSDGNGSKRAIARRRAMAGQIYKIKYIILCQRPQPTHCKEVAMKGLAINTIAMPLDQANGSTMVMFFFRVGPFFLVSPVLSWRKRYVQSAKLCFCILCLWMGSSTFQEFLGGKGIFYVFMFFENKPLDNL